MHTTYQSITSEINKCVSSVISSGCELHLHWVAGHTGLAPNELADIKAKEAAMDAALLVDAPHAINNQRHKLIQSKSGSADGIV